MAVITGLGGMGKTALTAEALGLWESRFEWVLLYQAKPNALGFDATLRDIHLKLNAELGRYHEHVKSRPADAIYRAADADLTGPERLDRLTQNLVRVLRDEAILLVLDNFETNLKPQAEPGNAAEPLWACQDPAWDRCLSRLATELVGTPSRVLITSRRPLAALAGTAYHGVPLGPLPSGEAALYLREHAGLSRMVFSGDGGEKALALRLLNASRFHPLLMDRLARLASGGPALRPQLIEALSALESRHDYTQLPALFGTGPGDAKELAYLNDALATSLDQLIRDAGPDARRLLWMIAVANDPVSLVQLQSVWSGEKYEHEKLWQIKQMLDRLPQLPPKLQEQLKAMPPKVHAMLDALPPEPLARLDQASILRYLLAVGLVAEERTGPDHESPNLTCHELVRARIRAWMHDHSPDRADLTENTIRLAYADWLEAECKAHLHRDMTIAREAGSRALIYYIQAGAYERLSSFASDVVTSPGDPRQLAELLPHMETAAESAPPGRPRWVCLGHLADALSNAGHDDVSLPFFEQAAVQARSAAEAAQAGSEIGQQAWIDLAWITGNWGNALTKCDEFETARQRQTESAEASKKSGQPAVHVIGRELETLRIDILQGEAKQALPQVEAKLAQVANWWRQHRSGLKVPEAPDLEDLARVLISALDIVRKAHFVEQVWPCALCSIDAVLKVKQVLNRSPEDIAKDRMNRANVLMKLGSFGEAKLEMEDCLQVFRDDFAQSATILSSLANLFYEQGDVAQAITQQRRALSLRNQLPHPRDRVISHANLSSYLWDSGAQSARVEAQRHRLAGLVYLLVARLGQYLPIWLANYAFHQTQTDGASPVMPRVAELLADPAFRPLDDWLHQRQADVGELQAAVDQLLDQARQSVLKED